MIRNILAAFLAVTGLAVLSGSAQAQCGYPQFGCGGFCMAFGSRLHAHGPLYDYSAMAMGMPYGAGYGGGHGYGQGHGCFPNRSHMSRSGLYGNGPLSGLFNGNGLFGGGAGLLHGGFGGGGLFHRNAGCGSDNCGNSSGYAFLTLRNVVRRINPFSGGACGLSNTGCQSSCQPCGATVAANSGCTSCGNSCK